MLLMMCHWLENRQQIIRNNEIWLAELKMKGQNIFCPFLFIDLPIGIMPFHSCFLVLHGHAIGCFGSCFILFPFFNFHKGMEVGNESH